MLYPAIDAHIHLDSYQPQDRSSILDELNKYYIDALIAVSNHYSSAIKNLKFAQNDSRIYPCIGYHPEQKLPSKEEMADLISLIKTEQHGIAAIGEVGLPYYLYQQGKVTSLKSYIEVLEAFIKQAKETDKPIVLHAVYEHASIVCDMLEKYSIEKAHFHWFKGDQRTIERLAANHYMISITPDILYKKRTQYLVSYYPISLMMAETDGPWPFEGEWSGYMTHSCMVHRTIEKIASLKDMRTEDVYKQLYHNTCRFYNLSLEEPI